MSFSRRSSQGPPSLLNGDDDQRFAELLRPIKDLTENWQVPLAELLDDYYEELTDIQIDLNGETTRVNFTEAALLLQGTASVYSKKVEFLYQNVLKMLHLLASQKALDEADSQDGMGPNGKRGRKLAFGDANNFSLVAIEMTPSVDLKSDAVTQSSSQKETHARKMSLKFIFVTPRQLIEKEGREQKLSRVNLHLKTGSTFDLLGHKEDFRINSQFSMATAMIGEDLEADTDLGQMSVSLCDDSFEESALNSMPEVVLPQNEVPTDPGGLDVHFDDDHDFFDIDNNLDVQTNDGPSNADNPTNLSIDINDNNVAEPVTAVDGETEVDEIVLRREGRRRKDRLADLVEEQRAPLADPWEPVKPHESTAIVKKRSKGRTSKPPAPNIVLTRTSTKSRRKAEEERPQSTSTIGQFVAEVMAIKSKAPAVKQTDNVPEELERQVGRLMKDKKSLRSKSGEIDCVNNDEVDDDGWTEANFNTDDNQHDDDNGGDFDFDDAVMPLTAHPNIASVSNDDGMSTQTEVDSYEDLVAKRVAAYVAQSKEYFESTDLAKRVRNWHETIAPKLDSVEKRGDFDVHDYGTNILSHFDSDDACSSAAKVKKSTYNFKELVVGKSREEACRVFLSSLMLANTYNIDLKPVNCHSKELPMDNIELTLLSKTRHFQQLMDYQAPSQERLNPTPPTSRQKGEKTRRFKNNSHDPIDSVPTQILDSISEDDEDVMDEGLVNGHGPTKPNSDRDGDFEFKVPQIESRKSCKRKIKL